MVDKSGQRGRRGRRRHGPGEHDRRRSRSCAGTSRSGSTGITADSRTAAPQSRGPQTAIVPELLVASTPLAAEVQKLLGNYLTLENRHDFEALQALYSKRLARSMTGAGIGASHQTSYFFGPKITEVTRYGEHGAYARMTFNVLFSPIATGADGQTCNRLDNRYAPGPGRRQARHRQSRDDERLAAAANE